ncbi:MAG: hypothetical protein OQJ91_14960 [Motiliproteus sp.]|nr:hypothetical protein [Motiliproteus sp.]
MTSAGNSNVIVWVFLMITLIVIQLTGAGYRGLRFVYNYEVTTAPVVACSKDHESDRLGEWFEFDIEVEGVEYPIRKIASATPREWGWSMFKTPPPEVSVRASHRVRFRRLSVMG